VKIDLSEYPAAGPIAGRAAARARASDAASIFKARDPSASPGTADLMEHGRQSWSEWWRERLRPKARRRS
jgi:hypothetical protein